MSGGRERSEPVQEGLVLTLEQAGVVLGVSERSIRRLIARGQLKVVDYGLRRTMVPRLGIEEFIAERSRVRDAS